MSNATTCVALACSILCAFFLTKGAASQDLREKVDLTCTSSSGVELVERVQSHQLGKEAVLSSPFECKAALGHFISSGLDLVSLSTDGSNKVYSFIGKGGELAAVPPPLVEPRDINCEQNTNPSIDDWTCKCTGGDVIYCELFCAQVFDNYYSCAEDESKNERVVRYRNLVSED